MTNTYAQESMRDRILREAKQHMKTRAYAREKFTAFRTTHPEYFEEPAPLAEPPWYTVKHLAEDAFAIPEIADNWEVLTSATIRLRTLRARIERFGLIEGEDYYVNIGDHGRKEYYIDPSMIGWVNRRLR